MVSKSRLTFDLRWIGRVSAAGLLLAVALGSEPLWIRWQESRARQALASRDNSRAAAALRQSLALAPDRAEGLFLLARLCRREGRPDRALALLGRAKALGGDPDRAERETLLVLAQAGRLRQAEPKLSALLIDPRDDGPDICEAYVQGYFTNLRLREAVTLIDAWEKDFPGDPQPHFRRGYVDEALGLWPEAITAYRRGLEMAPAETAMRFRLAKALKEAGQKAEAGEQFRRCVEERPDEPEFVAGWAEHLVAERETALARQRLRTLLAGHPDDFDARRLLGQIELAEGRFEAARAELVVAVRLRPYDTVAHEALGRSLRASGRAAEAKPHFDYVSEAEASLDRLNRLLRLAVERPEDLDIRCEIGTILLRYGSPDDGEKWLRVVLEADPNHGRAREALAAHYGGQFERLGVLPRRTGDP